MLDLRGADALRQRPERAVGRGVAVAADDGHAGLGAPLLGADHVHDAVARIAHREELDPGVRYVALQRLQLQPRLLVGDGGDAQGLALGRHVVVGHRERAVRPAHGASMRSAQACEGLRRRHLVNQMEVDVDHRLAARVLRHAVRVPDLVVEGPAGHAWHVG